MSPTLPDLECYGGPLDGDDAPSDRIPRDGHDGRYERHRLVLHRMQRSTVDPGKFVRAALPTELVWYWRARGTEGPGGL